VKAPYRNAFGAAERDAIREMLDYYKGAAQDPPYYGLYQQRFEAKFSDSMGKGFALAVNSGSSATYVAIKALELPLGSSILMSPVTDTSTLISIILAGHNPVIVDTSSDSYNANVSCFEHAYGSDVTAAYLVHAYGNPSDLANISRLCDAKGIKLIEDCSQAPFARTSENQLVGTVGAVSIFSTMYRKSLHTSSSGGLVYTNDHDVYKRAVEYSDRGRPKWDKNHDGRMPGDCLRLSHNFNTSELACAVGLASLSRIEETIKKRQYVSQLLCSQLKAYSDHLSPMEHAGGSSPFLLPLIFTGSETKRKLLFAQLQECSIPFAPRYNCFAYEWPITKNFLRPGLLSRLRRFPKKWIYSDKAALLQQSAFNLFINEEYDSAYVEFILSAFSKALVE